MASKPNGIKAEPNTGDSGEFTDSDQNADGSRKSRSTSKQTQAVSKPPPSRIGRVKKPPVVPSEPVREESPESSTFSLTFCGNVRFNSEKFDFKCAECGDTNLKTHYK